MSIEIPYKDEESKVFGKIKRPRIDFEIFSNSKRDWILIIDALADTGADMSLVPRQLGELLVEDVVKGRYVEIKGIHPSSMVIAFLHRLRAKVGDKEMLLPVAIADSNDVPSILGRVEGLDFFNANFSKGKKLILID